MKVLEKAKERTLLLSFSGEMDHHGVQNILQQIDMAIDAALPKMLTLDFSKVTFMDSSGIALILHSQQKMQLLKGNMILSNVPQQAKRVLNAAGINQVIRIRNQPCCFDN